MARSREWIVKMQKDLIKQVSKNCDNGNDGKSKKQRERLADFYQVSGNLNRTPKPFEA